MIGAAAAASAGGGEEGRTRGLKLCPLRVLAMPGCLDLGRDREGGRISSTGKEMEWLNKKEKWGGGWFI